MPGFSLLRRSLLLLLPFCWLSAHADALDNIIDRGTLRVGVAEFVPWTMRSKSGHLLGFEVDVAKKLARDMGVKADLKVYEWEDIVPALRNGEIDVIAGGMAITPARALRVNFSRPVAESGVGLATNTKRTRDIGSLEQMNAPDIIITTVRDTLAHSVARTLFPDADLRVFADRDEAEEAVIDGRAHAYLASLPEVRFLELKNEGKIDMPIKSPLVANKEALAIRKGQPELLNFLNAWVTAHQADKWLSSTRDYWFASLDWLEALQK